MKRRETYLGYVSLPISTSQKRELPITPGSGESLFSQDLLKKVSGQVKEDSFISSTVSLAKLARCQSLGRGKSSSSSGTSGSSLRSGFSGYTSPLDYGRAVHSSSPGRGPLETLQSVLLSVCQGDWMVSLDLKDAYLQVPIHPNSRKFLRFLAFGRPYQFRALCFGLSTAPQVFTRVMAPVSTFLHRLGIRIRWYLDDWLLQAQSQELVLQALETVLSLCRELDIVINSAKSNLIPSQWVLSLGMIIDSFKASPSQPRVEKLLSLGEEFLSSRQQPTSSWRVLLGTLSSLSHLVPGGRLLMWSLQLTLHRSWDQVDDSVLVQWDDWCLQDLSWWLNLVCLQEGVSLGQVSPNLDFCSDVGWGAHLGQEVASGRWSLEEASLSINSRELLAVERGLLHFQSQVSRSTVAVFADNSTTVAYLRKSGGTRSPSLNSIAQRILRWAEALHIVLAPQFIMEKNNVLEDALSRTHSGLSRWKCFWSSASGGQCWSISLPPRQITIVPSISLRSTIHRPWGRMRSSTVGTVSLLMPFHHGRSFCRFSRSSVHRPEL